MPNVPNVPGVPRLSSYGVEAAVLLFVDQIIFALTGIYPPWGIYKNGLPVIAADSVVAFSLRQDWPISDYPVERGAFQTYNKVELPADIHVTLVCGGSIARRQAFFNSIDTIIDSTELFDVVTPERIYLDYCFEHQDFRRTARQGNGLIAIDLWLKEIRLSSQATFQSTSSPVVAGQQGIGNVQPQSPQAVINQRFASSDWTVR